MIFDPDLSWPRMRGVIRAGRLGRPTNGFDKKAYDREQAAKRRAALKAAKEAK